MEQPPTPGSYVIVSPGTGSDVWRGSTVAFLVRLDGDQAVIRRLRGRGVGWRIPVAPRPPSMMKPVRVKASRLVREATAREVQLHRVETPLRPPAVAA